jgi:hypothetical protein
MAHRFVVMINGELHTYDQYEQIPDQFDHVIEFQPEIPPEPHTDAQHKEIDSWQPRFKKLMEIEHASSGQKR